MKRARRLADLDSIYTINAGLQANQNAAQSPSGKLQPSNSGGDKTARTALASLDVELHPRGLKYLFTTPRGDAAITAQAVSDSLEGRLFRLAALAGGGFVLLVLVAGVRRRQGIPLWPQVRNDLTSLPLMARSPDSARATRPIRRTDFAKKRGRIRRLPKCRCAMKDGPTSQPAATADTVRGSCDRCDPAALLRRSMVQCSRIIDRFASPVRPQIQCGCFGGSLRTLRISS